MSTAWITQQILRTPVQRLVDHPKFNPRPAGYIRPGSTTSIVYAVLQAHPGRWYVRRELIHVSERSRKSVDWAIAYLSAIHLIESYRTECSGSAREPRIRVRAPAKK